MKKLVDKMACRCEHQQKVVSIQPRGTTCVNARNHNLMAAPTAVPGAAR
jgi:hypothetical protein